MVDGNQPGAYVMPTDSAENRKICKIQGWAQANKALASPRDLCECNLCIKWSQFHSAQGPPSWRGVNEWLSMKHVEDRDCNMADQAIDAPQ